MLVSRNGSTPSATAVQVSLHETINSQLNSNWATADLLQVKSIILSDQNSKGSFFSADVTGVARTLNSSGVGFVLFQTSLGRFVLQEDSLLPAEEFQGGILVNASAMDIVSFGARSERELALPSSSLNVFDTAQNSYMTRVSTPARVAQDAHHGGVSL
jgi:hypothetical protein